MKKNLKKLSAILLIITLLMSVFTFSVSAVESGKVRVIVKNDVCSTADGAPWDGTLIDEWVELQDNSTMLSVVISALDNHGYTQTGAESNYITEVNGLSAFDNGYSSGWMTTVNDWFANEGCDAFNVKNGTLENGDEVSVLYSNDWGADIGSFWDSNSTKLKSLEFSTGELSQELDPSVTDYTLKISEPSEIIVTPTAENKNFQVKVYKNEYTPTEKGTEYKRSTPIKVSDGDKLIIACGDENWASMNQSNGASVYTVTVKTAVSDKIDSTASYFNSLEFYDLGSEWYLMSLARAGKLSQDKIEKYYKNVCEYVQERDSAVLDKQGYKSTENSRVIIALSSMGIDSRNVAGYNLVEPLFDFDFVKQQGINGPVYALIALDTLEYDIENRELRENYINYILDDSLTDGGWTLSKKLSTVADPDITGMVLQALAPYYKYNDRVKETVDKALKALSEMQTATGGFASWGSESVESAAQILTALTSLGIDVDTDLRFIKNGNSIVDAVMSYSVENGFSHIINDSYNQLSTEQAFYALVSYQRVKTGKTALYNMKDMKAIIYDVNCDGTFDIDDCTEIQKYAVNLAELNTVQLAKADATLDGSVSVDDVTYLQKLLAEI